MLAHRLPYPPDRGDRIRSCHLIKHLSKHFDLDIACTSDEPVWLQHHQLLSTMAGRVAIQPISSRNSHIKMAGALFTGKALTPSSFWRQGLADQIVQWHQQEPFDAVLTFCTAMFHYARLLMNGESDRQQQTGERTSARPRHVLDLVDVDSSKWQTFAEHAWPPAKWIYATEAQRLREIEADPLDEFDAVTVISQAEADVYRQSVGRHQGLAVVENGVDLDYFLPLSDAESRTIVFVGVLNYRPNTQGITWFVRQVMAKLRQRIHDVKLNIVGRHPTSAVQQLDQCDGVEVIGSVPDVRAYLADASAVIAPLQVARGVQNKVLEAMASARAVVCSPAAVEGIDATDGQHLLVANDPEQWVDHLERVLTDRAWRIKLAEAARQRVEQRYTWQECLQPMVRLLQGLDGRRWNRE